MVWTTPRTLSTTALASSRRGPIDHANHQGTLRPNTEGRVFEVLRDATRANPRPPGLLGVSISRHVTGKATELVAVSIWADVDAMVAVMGEKWREPT